MTAQEFQITFGPDLKKILETPMGLNLCNVLSNLIPQYEALQETHLYADNRGSIKGYQTCLRNLISLSMPPKIVEQPKADYGVPEKNQES